MPVDSSFFFVGPDETTHQHVIFPMRSVTGRNTVPDGSCVSAGQQSLCTTSDSLMGEGTSLSASLAALWWVICALQRARVGVIGETLPGSSQELAFTE